MLSIFILTIAFGCNIFKISLFIDLNTTSHLASFIPPPAELAQAPINITMSAEKSAEKVPDDQETEETPSTDGKEEIPSEAGPEASMYVEVTTNVNVRREPTTDSEKLGTVSEGTRLLKIGEEADGWTKVSYNDSEAYVKSDYVRKIE